MTTLFDNLLSEKSPGELLFEQGSNAHLTVESAEGIREPVDSKVVGQRAQASLERAQASLSQGRYTQ